MLQVCVCMYMYVRRVYPSILITQTNPPFSLYTKISNILASMLLVMKPLQPSAKPCQMYVSICIYTLISFSLSLSVYSFPHTNRFHSCYHRCLPSHCCPKTKTEAKYSSVCVLVESIIWREAAVCRRIYHARPAKRHRWLGRP